MQGSLPVLRYCLGSCGISVCKLSVVDRGLLWQWQHYECLCPLLLHLLHWTASDQPEHCLQRSGAASNPILCSKVEQTSHRPCLWCALRHQSQIFAIARLRADDKSSSKEIKRKEIICKTPCISTDTLRMRLRGFFLSLLDLFTWRQQQQQHTVKN